MNLSYQTEQVTIIYLKGKINEHSKELFDELNQKLVQNCTVHLNFSEVDLINSMGLSTWFYFIREFQKGKKIIFVELPAFMINIINTIPRFTGSGKIDSFYSNFICLKCHHESPILFTARKGSNFIKEKAERIICPECQGKMVLEDDKDHFYNFLKTQV